MMHARLESFHGQDMPNRQLERRYWSSTPQVFDPYMHITRQGDAYMVEGELRSRGAPDLVDMFYDLSYLFLWEKQNGKDDEKRKHRLTLDFGWNRPVPAMHISLFDFAVRKAFNMWGLCFAWKYEGRVQTLSWPLELSTEGITKVLGDLALYFNGVREGFTGPTSVTGRDYREQIEFMARRQFVEVFEELAKERGL